MTASTLITTSQGANLDIIDHAGFQEGEMHTPARVSEKAWFARDCLGSQGRTARTLQSAWA